MNAKDQTEVASSFKGTAYKALRWIFAGAAMLLIGFTIYSAIMRKFSG